jgi:hypothetical protein
MSIFQLLWVLKKSMAIHFSGDSSLVILDDTGRYMTIGESSLTELNVRAFLALTMILNPGGKSCRYF